MNAFSDDLIQKLDKYFAVVEWARRRYTQNGLIVDYVGLNPAPYTRIEAAACNRYLAKECNGVVAL